MNHELNRIADCFGLYTEENNIIGFIGVLHFPHPKNKKIKHIHRLVILPDYQGIGLGTQFLTQISDIYHKKGFDVRIVTSAKNLLHALKTKDEWVLVRYSKENPSKTGTISRIIREVKTGTYKYVGRT